MITVSIITRRLKEGKTYEDFRKAWYHTVGFGTSSKLYTALNVNDPREIVVMGFVESKMEEFMEGLEIDVKERLENPLNDIIEPEIGRKFGMIISEDDFSDEGVIEYKEPSINGKETDINAVYNDIAQVAELISKASAKRDRLK
ncbi:MULTISPECIES: hypothetical protein [Methanobacterium]|jgi:hypothetical protein|uniref:ROK family protein n=1 Tax=Methanobacterium veterum TaxID=408577 RepID=A0A9E5DNI8_9EURY|nr:MULTISPECIES: hypothetical protein [Methanobacterium]MCZ3365176.1 ROK family protein [Methanobacterium veterum]MCZ3372931.1 ROK family protein [Methanobacterium veterum]